MLTQVERTFRQVSGLPPATRSAHKKDAKSRYHTYTCCENFFQVPDECPARPVVGSQNAESPRANKVQNQSLVATPKWFFISGTEAPANEVFSSIHAHHEYVSGSMDRFRSATGFSWRRFKTHRRGEKAPKFTCTGSREFLSETNFSCIQYECVHRTDF